MTERIKEMYEMHQGVMRTLNESMTNHLTDDPEDVKDLLIIAKTLENVSKKIIDLTQSRSKMEEFLVKLEDMVTEENDTSAPEF